MSWRTCSWSASGTPSSDAITIDGRLRREVLHVVERVAADVAVEEARRDSSRMRSSSCVDAPRRERPRHERAQPVWSGGSMKIIWPAPHAARRP